MVGYVYKITNNVDGKSYVGQTTNSLYKRFNQHCLKSSRCKYIKNAIFLHGRSNFSIEVLIKIKYSNERDLKKLLNENEKKFIEELNTLHPNGYNLTTGGNSPKMSEESIAIRAEKHKKPIKCDETGQEWPSIKECAANFGVKTEFIHRVLRGVRDSFRGMSFSYVNPEKSKPKKIRVKKIRSLDSYNLDGFSSQREKSKRPIKCNETGQCWNSIQGAADYFGVKNETIHRVVRGARNHFKGLTFSYI